MSGILIKYKGDYMKKNVNSVDRIIRIVLSLVLFSSFFFLEGNLRFIALIGLIPLITGAISFCPLYRILGVSTCKIK